MRWNAYILSFILTLCAGCAGSEQLKKELDRAEQIIFSAPDSALHILASMDRAELPREMAARHALLYTRARVYCRVLPTNDSLIRCAWRYYKRHPEESSNQCKVLYYWGRIKLQEGDKSGALHLFLKIEEKLQETNEPYYLGQLHLSMGEIYYAEMNYIRAYSSFREAYGFFTRSGSQRQRARALLALTATSLRMQDMEQADHFSSKALELSDQLHNKQLIRESLAYIAIFHVLSDEYQLPPELLRRIEQSASEDTLDADYRTLACVQLLHDNPDRAGHYLRAAESRVSSRHELPVLLYIHFLANTRAGRFREASDNLHRYVHLSDSLTRSTLHTSTGLAERAYLRTRAAFIKYRNRNRARWEIAGGCLALFILGAGVLLFRQRIRVQRLRVERYMLLADEAQSEYRALARQIHRQHDVAKSLKGLITSRFHFMDKLGKTYYERENSSSQQSAIFQQVKQTISDFSESGEMLQELEQMENATHDDVMKKLRRYFPSMKPSDYRLLCYIFASFSSQVISLFMKENVTNIYARKSRLKTRIKNSESPDKTLFLSLLE